MNPENKDNNVNVTNTNLDQNVTPNPNSVGVNPDVNNVTNTDAVNSNNVNDIINEIPMNDSQAMSDSKKEQIRNIAGALNASVAKKEEEYAEKRKKQIEEIEANYKPQSNFKLFMLFTFFGLLIAFVLFLPEINLLVEKYFGDEVVEEKITDGVLNCKFTRATANLDITYTSDFYFTKNQLNKLIYQVETRGDADLDTEILDKTNFDCKNLMVLTEDFDGVDVSCEYLQGKVTAKQIFEYSAFNELDVTAAFSEAGGTYPEFTNKQNMDNVEAIMKSSGYDCKRKH